MAVLEAQPVDLEEVVAAAIAEARPELEQLVRARIRAALDEFVRELVAAELNGHSNGEARVPTYTRPPPAADLAEAEQVETGSKRCTVCRTEKPLADFHADRHMPDGHRARCRDCLRAITREERRRRRKEEAQARPFRGSPSATSPEGTPATTSAEPSAPRSHEAGSSVAPMGESGSSLALSRTS